MNMKKIILGLFITVLLFNTGCKDLLDINDDPYAVKTINPTSILSSLEWATGDFFAGGYYLNSNFGSFVQYLSSRELNNYSLSASTASLGNTWDNAYVGILNNCDQLILTAKEDNQYIVHGAIAKAIKGYIFMMMTDLWGDVPFTQFNVADITKPAADKSDVVYNGALELFKQAKTEFENAKKAKNALDPKSKDLFYEGNIDKWIKAVNTFELKLLVQSRKTKDKITNWQSTLTALLNENNFIDNNEDFQFPHSSAKSPQDERNYNFVDEYEGGQKTFYICPWIFEIMSGYTYNAKNNPFSGISDPRIPYYWVNQLKANEEAENKTDYRCGAFVSIIPASNSGFDASNQDASMTCIGIYPVGGKYDDGKGGAVKGKGTGIAPDKIMQAYSVPFMKAELILTGNATGDAAAELKKGIRASIFHVNAVSQAAKGSQTVPALIVDSTVKFQDAIIARFNAAANNDKKLEIVMTQKWIANYFNTYEAYTDLRRTGYPVTFKGEGAIAFSPNGHTTELSAGPVEIPLAVYRVMPRILYYPIREVETNPNIRNTRNITLYGSVFWDVQ